MTRILASIQRAHCPVALGFVLWLMTHRLNADIVINEVLAANQETNLDEFASNSDWIELVNTGADPVNLVGYWISDDAAQRQKWQFPLATLAPGERRLVWCSGRNQTILSPEFINEPRNQLRYVASFISLESEWRYLVGAPGDLGPPPDWYRLEFDDSGWTTGRPAFGFGQENLQTEFPTGINVALLRRVFHVDDPSMIPNLVFRARFDDGFVLYLNGVRILQASYSGPDPNFDTVADEANNPAATERFDLSQHRDILQAGDNVLAIALLNRPGSPDLRIDPELGQVPLFLHTSFELSRGGEAVFLSDPGGNLVDAVVFPAQTTDRSYGRAPDAFGEFLFMLHPTPSSPNSDLVSSELLPNDIDFRPDSGTLEGPTDVTLASMIPFEDFEIRYTTNGEVPDAEAAIYGESISVSRDTAIRAAGFIAGRRSTRVVTRTFFVSGLARGLALPLMAISLPPADFRTLHLAGIVQGQEEVPAYMEIFDAAGTPAVGTGFGMRRHGGAGRVGDFNVKKAYRAYFRGIYGNKRLRYPIIPDTDVASFDKLVLRSNFNDAFRLGPNASLIRDQVVRDLHEDMGGVISHGSWYNIFVNGAYRGLYNVVERMDREFLESYFPEEGENWDVIKTSNSLLDGSLDDWRDLIAFMTDKRLNEEERWEEAIRRVDVEAVTDYMIVNIWAQNHDWPQNNWYAARPRREDGRWFFLSWDAEFGIGLDPTGFGSDSFGHALSQQGGLGAPTATVFGALLSNPRYEEFLLEELDRRLNGALSPQNVLAHIDRLAALIQPDVDEEANAAGGSVSAWQSALTQMRRFATGRNRNIKNRILRSRYLTVPVVLGVTPDEILQLGPMEVTLQTMRATEPTHVHFNDIPATNVIIKGRNSVQVTLPFDIRLEGTPTIRIADEIGETSANELLTISFPHADVSGIEPSIGFPGGGDVVRIAGRNLTNSARVEFGGREARSVRLVDGGEALAVITPPGEGTVEVRVVNTRPADLEPLSTVTFTYATDVEGGFVRGDADQNGHVTISDAVALLQRLSGRAGEPPCAVALDANDSETIDISDAVFLLDSLFRPQSPAPPSPFPSCGQDATGDGALTCMNAMACP